MIGLTLSLPLLLFLLARFKRIVNPNLPAPPAPQGPSLGMGLGIPSITDAIPGSPLSIVPISVPDSLPLKEVGEVVDSPTEELQGAPFDALLPDTPDVTLPSVPQIPDLPVKPAVPDTSPLRLPVKPSLPDTSSLPLPVRLSVPDTSSLPLPDDELMKLLTDKDNIVSAMTQAAMSAASEGEAVDPQLLIERLDTLKAANERIESLVGLAPSPIQDAASGLPVRRQAPDTISLLSRLQELVESGQLDHLFDAPTQIGTYFALPPFLAALTSHSRYSANP